MSDLIERLRDDEANSFGGLYCAKRELVHEAATALSEAKAENERLREIVSKCASAVGAGAATSASLEFMEQVPTEVEMVTTRLKADATRLTEALTEAEAAMTIIPPRNMKARYLATLDVVRAALKPKEAMDAIAKGGDNEA